MFVAVLLAADLQRRLGGDTRVLVAFEPWVEKGQVVVGAGNVVLRNVVARLGNPQRFDEMTFGLVELSLPLFGVGEIDESADAVSYQSSAAMARPSFRSPMALDEERAPCVARRS